MNKSRAKLLTKILLAIFTLLALGVIGFVLWANTPLAAQPEALDALRSDSQVIVEVNSEWITFSPVTGIARTGLVFYPGGRVDYRAYALPLRRIAASGYRVILVRMPLNLAFFAPEKASEVISEFSEVSRWVIGGHSLGGAMAAAYAYRHPEQIQGLVLWAAYPAQANSLSSRPLKVVSIYATRDGLATLEKIQASRGLLPPDTRWVAIEGGNHSQFGSYGLQPGDGEATISMQQQLAQVVEATVDLLEEIGK
ncbi:MAG: alpha/beta fold hydrolase [Anaerolineales bacterium]